jgi:hypothetical protein
MNRGRKRVYTRTCLNALCIIIEDGGYIKGTIELSVLCRLRNELRQQPCVRYSGPEAAELGRPHPNPFNRKTLCTEEQ